MAKSLLRLLTQLLRAHLLRNQRVSQIQRFEPWVALSYFTALQRCSEDPRSGISARAVCVQRRAVPQMPRPVPVILSDNPTEIFSVI